jgi:rRNA biogenesis protein RRP5
MINSKKQDEEEEELESVESYETLITSNPNSSSLWIKYMNFYLKMAETEKARAIAERALKTIFYRDDNEKLNMWVALLNFECIHGSQASLDDTFNRASQNCDSYKIHSHMAEIYIKAHKLEVFLLIDF